MAEISDTANGQHPSVISLSHDRCHPCQGLGELFTYQQAMGGDRSNLKGKRMLFMWTKGGRNSPVSPTQDSLMIMSRMGMKITLCHPRGQELDAKVIDTCEANTVDSGGEFERISDPKDGPKKYDIVYARHWGPAAVGDDVSKWYCDERILGDAKFVHPMPVDRGIEASQEIVDGSSSLTRELIRNKYCVQKAVFACLARGN